MFQPVIKWSGSKRSQASTLLSYFPEDIKCYYEPFIGGGAMLYAGDFNYFIDNLLSYYRQPVCT